MNDGSQRCGNCLMFRPMSKVNEYVKSSHCSTREHNYYGSLDPKDPSYDKSSNPRQAFLAVSANSNSSGDCDCFEPDYTKIKEWREGEKSYKKHVLPE